MHHLNWAIDQLNEIGFQTDLSACEIVQRNPWSTVYRITTNQGLFFLKIVPPALSIEPKIIQFLHDKFSAPVPNLISINSDLHCFLMQDAGIQLHHYFTKNFNASIFVTIMREYTVLQINSITSIDQLLGMGIPDWRLARLPHLYHDLISREKLLFEDGITSDELISLKNLQTKFVSICERLSNYNVRETFSHADFHDKNILIDPNSKQTTIIDLGEVIITHPFFSLLNCIHMARENFLFSTSEYQELIIKCFEPWQAFETQEHLFEILSLIQQCWAIHAVLGEFRLVNSVDPHHTPDLQRQKRLATKLRQWISQQSADD